MTTGGALFDATGARRYRLWRRWAVTAPRVVFIMLNPSTADAARDDPTIRRCVGFARRWGFGSVEVVNLFAYRATRPAALRRVGDPVGRSNDTHILEAVRRARRVVAAWGDQGRLFGRDAEVIDRLRDVARLWCLGTTRLGCPRHPLYLRGTTSLEPFGSSRRSAGVIVRSARA